MRPSPHRISISRRSMLRGAVATLIIVTGGTVYRASDQGCSALVRGRPMRPGQPGGVTPPKARWLV